jgi:hypothetical protein
MGAFDDVENITLPPSDPVEAETFCKQWGWEPHEQVMLRGNVTVADQKYITNEYLKSTKGGDAQMRAGDGRYALLNRMIISWSFTRNGQQIPLTPANIDRLPANYSNPILERLDKLASAMNEQEQQDFLTSANGHTEVSSNLVTLLPSN